VVRPSLFLGLDQARFIQHAVLESPRARTRYGITSASPILDAKLLRISAGGREAPALATGEIPSRARAAGAAPVLLAGSWEDGDADRQWVEPTAQERLARIDRLHLPPPRAAATRPGPSGTTSTWSSTMSDGST
jgi:hypothetical protein